MSNTEEDGALHAALYENDVREVDRLMDGRDPNDPYRHQQFGLCYPLDQVATTGLYEMAEMLIGRGADPHHVNMGNDKSAFMTALFWNHHDLVTLFLGDLTQEGLEDMYGFDPIQRVRDQRRLENAFVRANLNEGTVFLKPV